VPGGAFSCQASQGPGSCDHDRRDFLPALSPALALRLAFDEASPSSPSSSSPLPSSASSSPALLAALDAPAGPPPSASSSSVSAAAGPPPSASAPAIHWNSQFCFLRKCAGAPPWRQARQHLNSKQRIRRTRGQVQTTAPMGPRAQAENHSQRSSSRHVSEMKFCRSIIERTPSVNRLAVCRPFRPLGSSSIFSQPSTCNL